MSGWASLFPDTMVDVKALYAILSKHKDVIARGATLFPWVPLCREQEMQVPVVTVERQTRGQMRQYLGAYSELPAEVVSSDDRGWVILSRMNFGRFRQTDIEHKVLRNHNTWIMDVTAATCKPVDVIAIVEKALEQLLKDRV